MAVDKLWQALCAACSLAGGPHSSVHRNERSLDAVITAMRIVTVREEVASQATSIAIGVATIWSGQRPGAGPA